MSHWDVDLLLLDRVCQPVVDWWAKRFGQNHFWLSRQLVLAQAVPHVVLLLLWLPGGADLSGLDIVGMAGSVLTVAILWRVVKIQEAIVRMFDGSANPARYNMRPSRIFNLAITLPAGLVNFCFGIALIDLGSLAAGATLAALTMVTYLICCSSPPPKREREAVPNAVPQPY